MARGPKAMVQPKVLYWLRTTSGLTIEEAARKLQTKPANLAAWEKGDDRPSMPQLRKLAKAFKRPISYFFLPEPVEEPSIPHDFRRLPNAEDRRYSPALLYEIRTTYRRRSLALDLAKKTTHRIPAFECLGTVSVDDNPELVGQRLRDVVNLTFDEQSRWRTARSAYNGWRQHIEDLGVLVFQITSVDRSQMLGFSLAYRELPVIGVNRKNQPNGRTFTMLHEFAHLMLGKSGICDIDESMPRAASEQRVEVFCNHVAGAAMVPRRELFAHRLVAAQGTRTEDWDDDIISVLARDFCASEEAIVRRLLITHLTTPEFYTSKRAEYQARNAQLARQERVQANDNFGRNMAREAVSNLSTFARIVIESYHSDIINLSEASKHLGVRAEKVATVDSLIR
ncbi:MAG: XRE family transcriptional regulator [Albidovulum sp.]|nr:XRE family transcriptional regulator [Albidovulum sp.]MDE0534264.1 XRE family transcriptional regulator [Albidovulum sp.]